jgi:phospholipase/carboxylesterase
MRELEGLRREPRGREVTSLVILLHGYGASGDDLIGLADAWQGTLPQTVFVAPHAPEMLPYRGYAGYQWFPLTFRDPGEIWRGVCTATPALERFLDSELARYRVDPRRLVLVGFSQGTMLALHVGLRRSTAPAAIVGFSGIIAGPEHLERDIKARPPVQLIHGDQDELIPIDALHITREALATAGLAVEWHIRRGLGHGIDPEGQELAGAFLKRALLS